jgi:O-acetyl-ADP-ribose deacetylase (regulator of RNase III)
MKRIDLVQGDITQLAADAIVNAANNSLLGGGGVDGAIHRAGGPRILEECKLIRNSKGGCAPGEAVITTGGNLKAKFVIHTVGPIWKGGNNNEEEILSNAYKNSLRLAIDHKLKTIVFPNISTGIYGFPKEKAALVALKAVTNFLETETSLECVTFCCYDEVNFKIYSNLLK